MSYRWRDPARVSPARRAELEARDRPEDALGLTAQQRARAERIRQYAKLRGSGLSKGQAAAALGVSRDTGRQYENARKATQP